MDKSKNRCNYQKKHPRNLKNAQKQLKSGMHTSPASSNQGCKAIRLKAATEYLVLETETTASTSPLSMTYSQGPES